MKRILVFGLILIFLAGCAAPTPAAQVVPTVPAAATAQMAASPQATTAMETPAPAEATATTVMAAPTAEMATTAAPEATGTTEMSTTAPAAATAPSAAGTQMVPVTGQQTYTVLVGGENADQGIDLEAFFPAALHVHTGDTVVWKQNVHEIHTVTFLSGLTMPEFVVPVPGAQGMMFNPQVVLPTVVTNGQYDGSSFATSGLMGLAQGQIPEYRLTFTKPGTYEYVCVVHSEAMMKGTIVVEAADASIPSPTEATQQGQKELDDLMAKAVTLKQTAQAAVTPDVKNADGTTTHHVMVGFAQGQIDLMSFFPDKVSARPGDTIVWTFNKEDMAPHTITFLNGTEEPAVVLPVTQGNNPPLLVFNPAMALPQNADKPLTATGVYSSGLIDPHAPGPHEFSLKVGDASGDLPFICILHEESGMKGTVTVAK